MRTIARTFTKAVLARPSRISLRRNSFEVENKILIWNVAEPDPVLTLPRRNTFPSIIAYRLSKVGSCSIRRMVGAESAEEIERNELWYERQL